MRTGDTLFADEPRIDMIKIDVEGMEIQALSGLNATISRHRPMLFVEVDEVNRDAFFELQQQLGYRIVEETKRTKQNQNFLMEPQS